MPPSPPAPPSRANAPVRLVWLACGLAAVALGLVGVFLPLLPTTPFMILAAACFARSSTRLENWLLTHRSFGPVIRDWRAHRAIPRKAKLFSLGAMALAFAISLTLGLGWRMLATQAVVLAAMGGWIATRPEGPRSGTGGQPPSPSVSRTDGEPMDYPRDI